MRGGTGREVCGRGSPGYRCERILRETEVWDTPPLPLTRRPGPAPGSLPARAAGPLRVYAGAKGRAQRRLARSEFRELWGGGAPSVSGAVGPVGGGAPFDCGGGGTKGPRPPSLKIPWLGVRTVSKLFSAGRQVLGGKPLTGGDASGSVSRALSPGQCFQKCRGRWMPLLSANIPWPGSLEVKEPSPRRTPGPGALPERPADPLAPFHRGLSWPACLPSSCVGLQFFLRRRQVSLSQDKRRAARPQQKGKGKCQAASSGVQ